MSFNCPAAFNAAGHPLLICSLLMSKYSRNQLLISSNPLTLSPTHICCCHPKFKPALLKHPKFDPTCPSHKHGTCKAFSILIGSNSSFPLKAKSLSVTFVDGIFQSKLLRNILFKFLLRVLFIHVKCVFFIPSFLVVEPDYIATISWSSCLLLFPFWLRINWRLTVISPMKPNPATLISMEFCSLLLIYKSNAKGYVCV